MKKSLLLSLLLVVCSRLLAVNANDYFIKAYGFDNFETGHSFVVLDAGGDTLKDASAFVELKEGSTADKVLHVRCGATAGFVILDNPGNITATALLNRYSCMMFDIMRASDKVANSASRFMVYFGKGSRYLSYQDSQDCDYNLPEWSTNKVKLSKTERSSLKTQMWIGLNSPGSDYLIDNILLLRNENAYAEYEKAKELAVRDSILQIELARQDSIMEANRLAAQRLLPEINKNMDVKLAYDFENYAPGTTFPVYETGKSDEVLASASATVVVDPKNSGNKVLHVCGSVTGNCYVELDNPDGLSAAALLGRYKSISLRLMRSAQSGIAANSTFNIMWGGNEAYGKSLPTVLDKADTWYSQTFAIALKKNSLKTMMRIGFNVENSDFYIDDIKFPELEWALGDTKKSVRYWADQIGKNFGTCLNQWTAGSQGTLAGKSFNMVVCENEMKFDATEPSRGQFNYSGGQTVVNTAQQYNMKVRGHTLVWHGQNPDWVSEFKGSRKEWESILKNHIYNVVGHWKGQIAEWDVVNECLEENSGRAVGDGYQTRTWSVWYQGFGDDSYIDSAFVWAHQADPSAKLYINDYNIGAWDGGPSWEIGKTHAMYNLAKRLRDAGIPIDGVGMQTHINVNSIDPAQIEKTVREFRKIGLNCIITEADLPGGEVSGSGDDAKLVRAISKEELQLQAEKYAALADIMIRYDNFPTLVVWGVTDDRSWLDCSEGTKPLLFYQDMTPHPAYIELRKTYQRWASVLSGVDPVFQDSDPTWIDNPSTSVYTISGMKVMDGATIEDLMELPRGLYIIGGKKYYVE